MTRDNEQKINRVFKHCLKGTVLTLNFLKKQGVSEKLAWWYVNSGWFERVADGAYKLVGDKVGWQGALHALQHQLDLPVHIGGKTALQLLGKSHYIAMGFAQQDIQLFAPPGVKLPAWVNKSTSWPESFHLNATQLMEDDMPESTGLLKKDYNGLELWLSSPERAALEVCYSVPKTVGFEEAAHLLEGLPRLRPALVQTLLEHCRSFKAKRLLLFFAEHYQHEWFEALNLKNVNLGTGKQVIAGGGQYHSKYRISTPVLPGDSL